MNQRWVRNSFVYLLILVAVVAIFYAVFRSPSGGTDVDITRILSDVREQRIEKITVDGNNIEAEVIGSSEKLKSRKEDDVSMIELLTEAGIKPEQFPDIEVKSSGSFGNIFGLLLNFLPLIFFGAIILFMMRQAQGTNNQAMSFGKSRARMFVGNRPTVTFQDVAGVDEAKTELQEVVEFLMYPERFASLGARIPKGVLLVGPPGTGKTLLARAVAGEAGVPFFNISGSEFVEMFVGVGASRVRDLFEQGRRNSPCIIFVDEIDAVGRHRGAGLGGGHDEREQTLNQILVEMDGFDATTNIIILAATNRPDILDPALLRPGRFDRRVVLDAPDLVGRKSILGVHIKGKPLEEAVDLEIIAKQTPGFSGADLANLVNESALLAARRVKKAIGMAELEEAIDRVIAGPERKSRVISPHEKEVAAYHETGHALVAHKLEHADKPHKVTIIARGMAGGFTRFLPAEDRRMASREQLKAMMAVALGGRVAEEIMFGDITSGASDDLQRTTAIARKMITEWGMSEPPEYPEVPLTTLVSLALEGEVDSIEVYGDDLLVRQRDGTSVRSRKEGDWSVIEFLREQNVPMGPNGVRVFVKSRAGLAGLGLRTFGRRQELVFLGKEISEQRDYGDKIADDIDDELRHIVDAAHDGAYGILTEHKAKLMHVAQHLMKVETVDGKALLDLLESEPPSLEELERDRAAARLASASPATDGVAVGVSDSEALAEKPAAKPDTDGPESGPDEPREEPQEAPVS